MNEAWKTLLMYIMYYISKLHGFFFLTENKKKMHCTHVFCKFIMRRRFTGITSTFSPYVKENVTKHIYS